MHTYIIAEIGQNHNGSVDLAKQLIDMAAMHVQDAFSGTMLPGVDAVKFTKRDLAAELSESQMRQPYHSPHSFGTTYGEHRAFLELSDEQHHELYEYAKAHRLGFVETVCAPSCLSLLRLFRPDRLKVASRDLTNLPLLEAMAETEIPMILSTGMSGPDELDQALEVITRRHDRITILHCLSQYPADYENINLRTLGALQERYPDYTIGYSDHSIGIVVPVAAVALGAAVIEKHVTLDRRMKGTDHWGSLEREGVWRMVRDIRNVEQALGEPVLEASQAAGEARLKLERSIATKHPIPKGTTLREEDLFLLSPGDGFRWSERDSVLGRQARVDIPAHEIIYPDMIA